MDPTSALAIAAAVVQFVDFTARLLSETHNVYKAGLGSTVEDVVLTDITTDLAKLSTEVENKSTVLIRTNESRSTSQETFLRICGECKIVCAELNSLVEKLSVKNPGTFKSFQVAAKRIWSKERILSVKERLNEMRQQMMMAAIVCIWEEGQGLSNRIPTTRVSKSESATFLESISPWQPLVQFSISSNVQPKEEVKVEFVQKAIINGLTYEAIEVREDAIPEAYASTFSWIFDTSTEATEFQTSPSFVKWLSTNSKDIYWVTGKPGSGKSTLMKFIRNHGQLRNRLQMWAPDQKLLICGFYFWNAGTNLQKSQEGLMRSVLREALLARPNLTARLFPKRWRFLEIFGHNTAYFQPWTSNELHTALVALATESGNDFKLALFVDGLDELEGDPEQLSSLIKKISLHEGVKICASSRPLNFFKDAFKQSPSLIIHELTKADISLVVQKQFRLSEGFREAEVLYPKRATQLLDRIAEKAQGVFIWVTLVIISLLERLTEGDQLPELENLLDELPEELAELYGKIWNSINARYRSEASQFFQIVRASIGTPDPTMLWLADKSTAIDFSINELSEDQRIALEGNMARRINSRTKGLLEVSKSGTVSFLHRTAYDWISSEDIWPDILSRTAKSFDPNFGLMKSEVLRFSDKPVIELSKIWFWDKVVKCLLYASRVRDSSDQIRTLVQLLDRLDYLASQFAQQRNERGYFFMYSASWTVQQPCTNDTPPAPSFPILPHWSVTQDDSGEEIGNCFVGLAAQFGMLSYVKEKVQADPTLIQPQQSKLSLLENAALTWKYWSCFKPLAREFEAKYGHIPLNTTQIINLVDFLISKGAKPQQKMTSSIYQSLLHDVVDSYGERGWCRRDADWHAIAEVLKMRAYQKKHPILHQLRLSAKYQGRIHWRRKPAIE